jgi:hypothetical protein
METAQAMNRLRLVKEQDGTQHVSGLVLANDEVPEALQWETDLHMAGGWTVERYGAMIRFTKGDAVRWVWVRSRPPLEDTL